MDKFIEVVAKSNLDSMVIIRSRIEKEDDLEKMVTYTMYRIRELNNMREKFEIEQVRAMNIIKERNEL